jgi:HlyD family secretion protein
MKTFLTLLVILAAAAGGGWYWHTRHETTATGPHFRTAPVTRQTVIQKISATGTVQPIKEVAVGTQVNGRILHLYADFNSVVTNDQIVALIDPAVYEANLARDTAQLKSNLANVDQTTAKLTLAEKDLVRKTELAKRNMLSKADLDAALADRDALAAQLKVAEAAIEQSSAAVKLSKTNLDYCTIRSPVNGIVIARNVDEGQTVVSSMNAQQLFLIATDLSRIQVEASVVEADIGQISTNQTVTFTVYAHPNTTFTGEVEQVRLAATTVNNVVTYPVIVEADNPGMKLFPGMTADIKVEIAREEDAPCVPAAALRITGTNFVTDIRGPKLWLLAGDGSSEAVRIRPGISDGTHTVVHSDSPLEGREAILGLATAGSGPAADATKNPFMPTPPGGNNRNVRRAMR